MLFQVLKLVRDIFELGCIDKPLQIGEEIFHTCSPGLILSRFVFNFEASNIGSILFNLVRMFLEGIVISLVLTVL